MGTVAKYVTPGGTEGYLVRDTWHENGRRKQTKARFPANKWGGLKQARKEAEAWLAERQAARNQGVIWQPSRETLGSLLDRWEKKLGPPLAGNTVACYKSAKKNRFDEEARALVVGDLTPDDLQGLIDHWRAAGKSENSIRLGWVVIKSALRMARREGGIKFLPIEDVEAAKETPIRDEVWTPEQVRTFLAETVKDRYGYAWPLLLETCCRIGELCSLRWDDIDLEAGRVTFRRTWGRDHEGKGAVQTTTKTHRVLTVPIPPGVAAGLLHEKRTRTFDDSGWVVADEVKQPCPPWKVRGDWQKAVARTGLPELNPHGARHSGATNMINRGVSAKTASKILRHADVAMTLRRYVHPQEQDMREAVEELEGLYGGQMGSNVVPMVKKAR